jgi:glycosyltransferase involved in cell wall biosynthesis
MKILFLNYEYPPLGGGAGNATKFLLQEYAKDPNVHLDLVTSAVDEEFVQLDVSENIRIFRLPIGKSGKNFQKQSQWELLKYSWKAYWFIRDRIKKGEKYDGVHAFFSVPCGFLALLLRWEFHLPYIVSLRGADVPGYAEKFAFVYTVLTPVIRYVWKKADRVVSNSQGLKELALKTYSGKEISLIYNGVDTDFFQPDFSKRNKKSPVILCASRLTQRKGLQYAIEGFSLMSKKYPNVTLCIAGGDGDAKESLHGQVKNLRLEDRVCFSGEYTHADLLKLQQSSDIFLFPSLNEGMSNSMLEAMASGLPVIMTPTGGAKELIRDGENGFLVKFRDSEDIAEKLAILLEDGDLRQKMSEKSREKALSLSWSVVAKEYRDLYEKTFGDGRK